MQFNGKYFDGKSSVGYPADIFLDTFDLKITYYSRNEPTTIVWQTEQIHTNDFSERDKVILKYGEFPFQYIEVGDKNVVKTLKLKYPKAEFHQSGYHRVFESGIAGIAVLILVFLGLIACTYFYVLPFAAEKLATAMPISWEEELGNSVYEKYVNAKDIDVENSARLNQFFKELHFKSAYKPSLVIVKDNMVNAFALPGGKIIVYEGILRKMNSADELAALLSHEFSHVELKHSTKNIARSLSSALLLTVLFGDATGITALVIQNADQLKQLGYSRNLEHEADENGLRLLKEQSINPQGMADLFNTLKLEEGEDNGQYAFLSTHPLTKDRIDYARKEISKKDFTIKQNIKLDSLWKEIKTNLNE
jgi:Zn-dependent protease with chaperone function